MKSFYTIFKIILLLILAINPIFFVIFDFYLKELTFFNKMMILSISTIVSFSIIMLMVKKFYHDPIKKLEITIKHFLV